MKEKNDSTEAVRTTLTQSGRGIRDHIKAVGAYSILITFLAVGLALASIFWSSSNAGLQSDLRRSQEAVNLARDELSQLKSEYARYRGETRAPDNRPVNAPDNRPVNSNTNTNALASDRASSSILPEQEEASIEEGKTATFFGGISLSV